MKKRISKIHRKTKETDIKITINLDGKGKYDISSGIPFFNHMLESFAKHSGFDLKIQASGDTEIDNHHTVEDIGITLGSAIDKLHTPHGRSPLFCFAGYIRKALL